jgi:exopolysaccharide biosynthesis polyprenyl glycosylphosphotransferase
MLPKSLKSKKQIQKKSPQIASRFLLTIKNIHNLCRVLLVNLFVNNLSEMVVDIRAPKGFKINAWKTLSWLRIIFIAALDSLAIALAWIIAKKTGTPVDSYFILRPNQEELGFLWLILPINLCIMSASGIYGTEERSRSYGRLFKAICLAQIAILLIIFLLQPGLWISRSAFLLAWGLTIILVSSEKVLLKMAIINFQSKFTYFQRKVLLLGTLEDIIKAKQLIDFSKIFKIQGTADLSICRDRQRWKRFLDRSENHKFDEIFLCSWDKVENPISLLWELKSAGVNWRILPINLRLPKHWSEIVMLEGIPTIRFYSSAIVGADFWCKRVFDLVTSALLLVILALPMLLIALLIKLDSPGAIFYKQCRVGLKGKHFQVWKFRTMVENAHELQQTLEADNEVKGGILFKIKDDPRITKVGRFLRRYSLDELPQLINVLRKEMSLVGPRPLPLRDVAKLSPYHLLRHEVLPGITGLWQVSGRSDTDSAKVFNLDFIYIQNWSLILDLQILLRTVQIVFGSKGAY